MKEKASKRQKETKKNRSDKFCYSSGDIKFIKDKKSVKESYSSFAEFLFEKEEVPFNDKTMRWITIKDERDRNQHILIKKKDGTILGGMGGEHTGEKLKDVFDDLEDKRDDIEQKQENKTSTKYAEEIEKFRKYAINEWGIHDVYGLKSDDVTYEEYEAIENYTGSFYEDVNKFHRDYDSWYENERSKTYFYPDDYDTEEEYEEAKDNQVSEAAVEIETTSQGLSSALKKHPSKENMISYRGLAPDLIKKIMDKLVPGNEFTDEGFVSTSTKTSTAKSFSKGGYVMEIHIPKGSRAASVKNISSHWEENEVLIDRGSSFLIKQVDHENKTLVVELKQK